MTDHGDPVGLAVAARAVLAARTDGPAVAVIARADEGGGRLRVLVFEDGSVRGTLGSDRLDAAASEVGNRLLASPDEAIWTLEADLPTDANDNPAGSSDASDPASTTVTLYAEVHRPHPRLFVVGAGHIAVPLARVASLLGFPVVVLDDREGMATGDRFPDADRIQALDFERPFAAVAPAPADFVVLVTRAHKYDFDCLRSLLDAEVPPRYIGMVGSRRRVRAALVALAEAGVPAERLASIHAPIGTDIGAETPEEIAVSIAAELVAVRRGVAAGGSLRDVERVVERFLETDVENGED